MLLMQLDQVLCETCLRLPVCGWNNFGDQDKGGEIVRLGIPMIKIRNETNPCFSSVFTQGDVDPTEEKCFNQLDHRQQLVPWLSKQRVGQV